MTTRIITFLIGNPYKPSFTTVTVRGDNPKYNYFSNFQKWKSQFQEREKSHHKNRWKKTAFQIPRFCPSDVSKGSTAWGCFCFGLLKRSENRGENLLPRYHPNCTPHGWPQKRPPGGNFFSKIALQSKVFLVLVHKFGFHRVVYMMVFKGITSLPECAPKKTRRMMKSWMIVIQSWMICYLKPVRGRARLLAPSLFLHQIPHPPVPVAACFTACAQASLSYTSWATTASGQKVCSVAATFSERMNHKITGGKRLERRKSTFPHTKKHLFSKACVFETFSERRLMFIEFFDLLNTVNWFLPRHPRKWMLNPILWKRSHPAILNPPPKTRKHLWAK